MLKYLARYTHRVAISNDRLLNLRDGDVTFRYKDYADGHATKSMTLTAVEFIRRFLQHVLPKGFVKIRHYGFMANRGRQAKLALVRQLLPSITTAPVTASITPFASAPATDACPVCRQGKMVLVETLHRLPFSFKPLPLVAIPQLEDTS